MRAPSRFLFAWFLSCSFLLGGCAGDRDSVEKHLASMRAELQKLQTENDRLHERVRALEAKETAAPGVTTRPLKPAGRRPLKVITLIPEDPTGPVPAEPPPDERPDAPGSRPVIRLRGSKAEVRSTDARLARQFEADGEAP